jgi:hypothetical protein
MPAFDKKTANENAARSEEVGLRGTSANRCLMQYMSRNRFLNASAPLCKRCGNGAKNEFIEKSGGGPRVPFLVFSTGRKLSFRRPPSKK